MEKVTFELNLEIIHRGSSCGHGSKEHLRWRKHAQKHKRAQNVWRLKLLH